MAVRGPAPQRWQYRCQTLPTDALIDFKVWCQLGRFIPIWRNVDTIVQLRAVIITDLFALKMPLFAKEIEQPLQPDSMIHA